MSGAFPAVAATNQNVNSDAFAEARERARLVAAKLSSPTSGSSSDSLKRNLEDSYTGEPESKKPAIFSQTQNTSNCSNTSSAAQVAAAQAAVVTARVAAATAGVQGVGVPSLHLGPVSSKDIKVPDKMVGLIIGRGGEQITRLQAESGCKIQMAADSGGLPDRMCTLTGNTQSIAKAEDLIQQIVQSRSREILPLGNGAVSPNMNMPNSGSSMGSSGLPPSISTVSTATFTQIEIMVPGPKVGLIIGKGGETIKQLQEKSGAKMVIIQDGPSQEAEKPLRISGDPQKVEHAKALVYEFMAEKEQQLQKTRGGGGGRSGGGSYSQNNNSRAWDPEVIESSIAVPAGKCGVIIGKGGETIKQINQQTGAHCEIDRRQQANMQEKVFIIKGTPDQIEHAKRLFSDKLNMDLNRNNSNGLNNYGMGSGMSGGPGMGNMSNYNGASPWPMNIGGPQSSFQQSWPNTSQTQNPAQQMQQHSSSGPNANNGVQVDPVTGEADYSAQWVEYYKFKGMFKEAAVIEQAKAKKSAVQSVNSQELASQGQMSMPGMNNLGQGQMPGQQSMSASPQQQGQGDQSGFADYSAQWAQYYRALGQVDKAEAIEAQMKAKVSNQQAQPNANMVSSQSNSSSVPNMYNQQAALAAQYGLGGFPTSATTQNYYGTPQPQGNAQQYAYANYNAYQQQPASNDSHQ